jgi:hypothetical protein
LYQEVIALDADNPLAVAGKTRVFKTLLNSTEASINANKLEQARRFLSRADAINPNSAEVRLIRVRLDDAKKTRTCCIKKA